jgi:hypothetical protein
LTISPEWLVQGGPRANKILDLFVDEIVLDAFPFQILCPGHMRRVGDDLTAVEPLELGRAGLAIGSPADWLIEKRSGDTRPHERRNPQIQQEARDLLRGCLIQREDVLPLIEERQASDETALRTYERDPRTRWRGVPL